MKKGEELNYGLNTRAVDDLVNANIGNTPVYSEEELNKYKAKKKLGLAPWLKAVLIKYWFAGMVCFFFIWGLGIYIANQLDLFSVTCIAMGFVTDILVNNIFRFYEKTPGENSKWMMFPKKSFLNLFLNVIYAFVVMSFVYFFYNFVNVVAQNMTGITDKVLFGVEPFSFGLVYLGFDMMFIGLKHLVVKIFREANEKAKGE